jgi:UDP-N-acetylglucosamine diphosphorylase/glucosamine-1-phosphate N-acetyltransferase
MIKNEDNDASVIILAAGLGTRMKSRKAKVLHELSGRPMILYVVETASEVVNDNVVLVVGHQAEKVRQIVSERYRVTYALQEKQLGTGHAVLTAMQYLPTFTRDVVILYGDVPLLMPQTIRKLLVDHRTSNRDITLLGVELDNPTGYGRLLLDKNRDPRKIVEESDATPEQKQIKTINTGIYCVKKNVLSETLQKTNTRNAQGERYLTDIIEIGNKTGMDVGAVFTDTVEEIIGVNTPSELKTAEKIMRKRLSKRS